MVSQWSHLNHIKYLFREFFRVSWERLCRKEFSSETTWEVDSYRRRKAHSLARLNLEWCKCKTSCDTVKLWVKFIRDVNHGDSAIFNIIFITIINSLLIVLSIDMQVTFWLLLSILPELILRASFWMNFFRDNLRCNSIRDWKRGTSRVAK